MGKIKNEQPHVNVIASRHIQDFLEGFFFIFFQYKIRYIMVIKKKNPSIECEDEIEKSILAIAVCHHSANLVMPIGDPRVGFFYPTLTLMIDSYILSKNDPRRGYLCHSDTFLVLS